MLSQQGHTPADAVLTVKRIVQLRASACLGSAPAATLPSYCGWRSRLQCYGSCLQGTRVGLKSNAISQVTLEE